MNYGEPPAMTSFRVIMKDIVPVSPLIFTMFKWKINLQLNSFLDYIEESHDDLIRKRKELAFKMKSSGAEDAFDLYEDVYYKYFEAFPVFTFNPMLLMLMGYFEHNVIMLAELAADGQIKQGKGKDLEKCMKYLQQECKVNLSSMNSTWEKITTLQKLRNCIAHHDANLKYFRAKKRSHAKDIRHIIARKRFCKHNAKHGDFYIKDKQFMVDSVETIRKYLNYITKELAHHYGLSRRKATVTQL